MERVSIWRARSLRRSQTDAEARLWQQLRDRQVLGYKFVRQYPIGRFIVDFCCKETRLVIEVDGGQHDLARNYDAERSSSLNALGYTVIRFWNNEVLRNISGVLERTAAELEKSTRRYKQPSP